MTKIAMTLTTEERDYVLAERNGEQIAIRWSIEDVLDNRPWITNDEAKEVLYNVKNKHDANIGVNWDTIAYWADELYPKPKVKRICRNCGTEFTPDHDDGDIDDSDSDELFCSVACENDFSEVRERIRDENESETDEDFYVSVKNEAGEFISDKLSLNALQERLLTLNPMETMTITYIGGEQLGLGSDPMKKLYVVAWEGESGGGYTWAWHVEERNTWLNDCDPDYYDVRCFTLEVPEGMIAAEIDKYVSHFLETGVGIVSGTVVQIETDPTKYLAFGNGYSKMCNTFEEAKECVRLNGNGGVFLSVLERNRRVYNTYESGLVPQKEDK